MALVFSRFRNPLVLIACLAITLPACQKEEVFRVDGFDPPVLAISARIDPVSGFEASIVRTLPPTEEESFPIEELYVDDAEVTIINQTTGDVFTAENELNGRYSFHDTSAIKFGDCYVLSVLHPDFPAATSAEVCIPAAPQVQRFTTTVEPYQNTGIGIPKINFSINDRSGPSYYLINVATTELNPRSVSIFSIANIDLEFCEYYDSHDPYGIFFTDACFEQKEANFSLYAQIENRFAEDPINEIEVTISTTTYDYFRYLENFLNLDDIRGWIVEPVSSYTNITNGIGVFAATNSVKHRVDVP